MVPPSRDSASVGSSHAWKVWYGSSWRARSRRRFQTSAGLKDMTRYPSRFMWKSQTTRSMKQFTWLELSSIVQEFNRLDNPCWSFWFLEHCNGQADVPSPQQAPHPHP